MSGRMGCFVLAFSLGTWPANGQEDPSEGKGSPKVEEPSFRSAKSTEAFQKARKLFDQESYNEALLAMKRLRDQGKSAADREVLQNWIRASEGGVLLSKYRQMFQRGVLRTTLFSAMDQAVSYRGTPVAPRYEALINENMPRVIHVLENFDTRTNRYSKKYGKDFINDPKIVFRGAYCLEWVSTKAGKPSQLALKDVPQKWAPFHSVVFWIRCEQPVELQLIALSSGSDSDEDTDALVAIYSPPARGGWVRAEVTLDQFRKHGSASFGNVGRFVIQIESKTTYKFYIDELGLVRKDSPGAGVADSGADSKEGKNQKKSKKKPPAKE